MKKITLIALLLLLVCATVNAADGKGGFGTVATTLPYGYSQLGTSDMYYSYRMPGCQIMALYGIIDVMGYFNGEYYSSTYDEGGYQPAFKVGGNAPVYLDCMTGTTNHGVVASARIEPYGNFGRIVYTFTNTNNEAVTISAGVYADVQIGDSDDAPMSRIKDANDNTYGLLLRQSLSSSTVALNVLFGEGVAGVTPCDDYWFGSFGNNRSANEIVGNYTQTSNWMEENGNYDSAVGWCWRDRNINSGETIELSFLIGIGDLINQSYVANVEVYYENLPDWNYIGTAAQGGRNHEFTVEGTFLSVLSETARLYYQVDDDTEWTCANANAPFAANADFSVPVNVMLDYDGPVHALRLKVVGETGDEVEIEPIGWPDVKNCFDTYALPGHVNYEDEPVVFDVSGITELDPSQYTVTYVNNNAPGTATLIIEGVYAPGSALATHIPYDENGTVGRIEYQYEISGSTGIVEVSAANASDNVYYNMQGVRVDNPGTGIYIHNGKKVVVK